MTHSTALALIMTVASAMLALADASYRLARGHEAPTGFVFDTVCCNGNGVNGDCQPIPRKSVEEVDGGYQVTLAPGDHPMVTKPHVYRMERSLVRWTDDGETYACLYPTEDTLRCLYLPPEGS